VKVMHKL